MFRVFFLSKKVHKNTQAGTRVHAHTQFSSLKERWVGRPPGMGGGGRGRKEAATEDVRLLLNMQLIGNLLVCHIPAFAGQLPTWCKALFIELSGKVSCHWVHVRMCIFLWQDGKPALKSGRDASWLNKRGLICTTSNKKYGAIEEKKAKKSRVGILQTALLNRKELLFRDCGKVHAPFCLGPHFISMDIRWYCLELFSYVHKILHKLRVPVFFFPACTICLVA